MRGSRIARVENMSTDPKIKINAAAYDEMYKMEETVSVQGDADHDQILNFNKETVMLEIKSMVSPERYPASPNRKKTNRKWTLIYDYWR